MEICQNSFDRAEIAHVRCGERTNLENGTLIIALENCFSGSRFQGRYKSRGWRFQATIAKSLASSSHLRHNGGFSV